MSTVQRHGAFHDVLGLDITVASGDGRTQQRWTVDVRDGEERLVAKGELRLADLPAGAV